MGMDIDQLTAKWLSSLEDFKRGQGRPRRILSPWDEIGYFDTPKQTVITLPAAPPAKQVATANPMRVVLLFSNAGAGIMYVSLSSGVTATNGIVLGQASVPLIITQKEHGPLCQAEWFGIATSGLNIIVQEILLREWPRQ